MGVGKPRLDQYERVRSRLFENLALFIFSKEVMNARRNFWKNLCFLCDFRKGGDTTTATALESQQNDAVFWIAANATPGDEAIACLADTLDKLSKEPKETEEEQNKLRESMTKKCIDFADPRLKKECKLLSRAAIYCEEYLTEDATAIQGDEEKSLLKLPQFFASETDIPSLGQIAYDARHDPQMAILTSLSRKLSVAPPKTAKNFRKVRNFIRHFAERVHIPRLLIQDSLMLGSPLSSCTMKRLKAPIPAIVPPADGLRNLNSILKRILRPGDPRLQDMQNYLARLDGPLKLEEAAIFIYEEDHQARIHAEIQILKKFHRQKRMLSSELSKAVKKQIETQQQPNPRQPDFLMNITENMQSVSLGGIKAEDALESGDEWSDGPTSYEVFSLSSSHDASPAHVYSNYTSE
ncbi:hypothetical protein FBEOM_732 [Fusarium beomiforme]|uniref:Uncharacterized protein n=1 Tax=Fusarium beomiforme TaxID=44412 RepID=A0A9P5AUK8_9HYPO|nr:hypothetical protein FBEOM_732 [Fusarium beomiforme]